MGICFTNVRLWNKLKNCYTTITVLLLIDHICIDAKLKYQYSKSVLKHNMLKQQHKFILYTCT